MSDKLNEIKNKIIDNMGKFFSILFAGVIIYFIIKFLIYLTSNNESEVYVKIEQIINKNSIN